MFIGSADWMPRNLDNRVEVIAPVYDPEIKADLKRVVEYGLKILCKDGWWTEQERIVLGYRKIRQLSVRRRNYTNII